MKFFPNFYQGIGVSICLSPLTPHTVLKLESWYLAHRTMAWSKSYFWVFDLKMAPLKLNFIWNLFLWKIDLSLCQSFGAIRVFFLLKKLGAEVCYKQHQSTKNCSVGLNWWVQIFCDPLTLTQVRHALKPTDHRRWPTRCILNFIWGFLWVDSVASEVFCIFQKKCISILNLLL